MTIPKDSGLPVKSKKIDGDETAYILRRCLRPIHLQDKNVMGFIAEYLLCRNTKQAANKVGLSAADGNNLRRRPDIHEAIVQITEKACFKHGFDAAEVVERTKEIMNVDPAEVQKADGSFINNLIDIPHETRRAIKKLVVRNIFDKDPNGMDIKTGEIITIEFWDKMKAVELLGREKELFKESKKITHDIAQNMSNILLESRRLAEETVVNMRDVEDIEVEND